MTEFKKPVQGWFWPFNSKKAHYFAEPDNKRSLCGRWMRLGGPEQLEDNGHTSPDNCALCQGASPRQKRGGNGMTCEKNHNGKACRLPAGGAGGDGSHFRTEGGRTVKVLANGLQISESGQPEKFTPVPIPAHSAPQLAAAAWAEYTKGLGFQYVEPQKLFEAAFMAGFNAGAGVPASSTWRPSNAFSGVGGDSSTEATKTPQNGPKTVA